MRHFSVKAQPRAEKIIEKYGYCVVTPLKAINEWGDVQELKPVKCYTVKEVEELYYEYYDIHITTPDGDNY